ncbi:flagellar basal body L-ring protein FlgH [Candidatus Latescibacterota bacterium]
MKKIIFFVILGICFILAADYAFSESPETAGSNVSLYSDVKASKIGDVLSVIISEINSASKNTRTSTQKQNKNEAEGAATTGALSGLFPGMGGSMDISGQYSGQGTTSRSGQLSSRMSVKVVDITPNNFLVIEGSKTMEINEDMEVVTISGIVDPFQVSASNTIYSYQIANAKITYKGKGSVSQAHRPGLLVRIINWLL